MITRMSKIAVIGPTEKRMDVLSSLSELRIMEIDPAIEPQSSDESPEQVTPPLQQPRDISERLFLQNLQSEIESLLGCFPAGEARKCYIDSSKILDSISEYVESHQNYCREKSLKRQEIKDNIAATSDELALLEDLAPYLQDVPEDSDLIFYAIELKEERAVPGLNELLHREISGHYEIKMIRRKSGNPVALVTTDSEHRGSIEAILHRKKLPEKTWSGTIGNEKTEKQVKAYQEELARLDAELKETDRKFMEFVRQWRPIYECASAWIRHQLALLNASTSVYETDYCFVLFGWVPTADVSAVRSTLQNQFGNKIVVEEKEIYAAEVDTMPVRLRNPAYFRPFEIFSRLLPLPRYSSLDPTPFIGIFFPVFFGLMLGDAGYGILLTLIALPLALGIKDNLLVVDAGKVLGVCAAYTIIFGFLFGEFFGELGHRWFGLEPILFNRRVSILPMLLFALAVGLIHVCLGLILGFFAALRHGERRKAAFKLVSVLIILLFSVYIASYFPAGAALTRKPLVTAMGIGVLLLLVTGGLLAPLEMLKSIGNIISYARIMAVGLTSVLLAYVANNLAGSTGSLIVGIFVGILLHGFNIILGVFAPTVHSLRLHFVEFFSKFVEPGGRKFRPLE